MKKIANRLKHAWRVLFCSKCVIIYDNKDESMEWTSFGMDLEDVQDISMGVAQSIDDIIQDYIDMEEADRVGERMINMFHLN